MKPTILNAKYCILLFLLIVPINVFAQRERNYIYLLDCTKSMAGYNGAPDIWESTKKYLKNDIERHTPCTMVHVVPFQGKSLPTYSFLAQDFKWFDIENNLDSYIKNVTNTNICDAWDISLSFIDTNKDNYIYLLTDGLDNVKGITALASRLDNFCGKYIHTRAFYVVLTEAAIDIKIKEIVDNCPDEQFVDATEKLDPFGCFDDNLTIYANTLNLDKVYNLMFSAAGEFSAEPLCDDEYFSVSIQGGKIKDGIVPVKIQAKKDLSDVNALLPEQYEFTFEMKANGVNIINPTINVIMTNIPERDLEMIGEEQDLGNAEWYDSFLFWGAKEPDTLKVDLKANFNDEAKKNDSEAVLKIEDIGGLKDFSLFFNGKPLEKGILKLNAGDVCGPTILGIVFKADSKEGKRYFLITPIGGTKLECINGSPIDDFSVTLRAKYDIVWNPLKVILVCTLIAILVALLLWFLILKRIFFPAFNVGSLIISDPYYSSIKLKGARKLIFSNHKISQSALSRLFTGIVLYNVNNCWTQPLEMEPANKKVRVRGGGIYVFDPCTSQLSRYTDYVVQNTETREKIKMTIN